MTSRNLIVAPDEELLNKTMCPKDIETLMDGVCKEKGICQPTDARYREWLVCYIFMLRFHAAFSNILVYLWD
jgi:hypothetical protein